VFKSQAILVGSPTVNKGILSSVAGIMEEIKGLSFTNKKAAAFGSYGWGGESVKIVTELLQQSGFEVITEGLKVLWNPTDKNEKDCFNLGEQIVAAIK